MIVDIAPMTNTPRTVNPLIMEPGKPETAYARLYAWQAGVDAFRATLGFDTTPAYFPAACVGTGSYNVGASKRLREARKACGRHPLTGRRVITTVEDDPRYCDVCRFGAVGQCDERCELRPPERERLVAPRATLSQIQTLAAFESLTGYLTEVTCANRGRMLRVNFPADDAFRTGVEYIDVTVDGVAYVKLTAGGWNYIPREEARAILRDLMAAGAQ